MIKVIRLWNTANQRSLSGTSGFDDEDSINDKIQDVQTELIEFLSPFYEVNQQVRDALAPFVVTQNIGSINNGFGHLVKPDDYVHSISVSIDEYPCYPINVNEEAEIKRSPIRRPSLTKKLYYHVFKNDMINLLPATNFQNVVHAYIRKPNRAFIVLAEVDGGNSDYYQPDESASVNLEWPESMFNLILYLYLEKLGIEIKESILTEYAAMGINRETIKPQPIQ